jgi:pimeloyl-ACP methyl ester carboxylesterase
MRTFDVEVDLTGVPGLADGLRSVATVFTPDAIDAPVTVIVGYPGSGFNRLYYDIAAEPGYSEAAYHVDHGIVFVACDHVGIGDSTPCDLLALTLESMAAANDRTAVEVVRRLREGTLASEVGPIEIAGLVGIGQSMGGCLLTVQQANHATFDGIALLGWSAVHENIPLPDGSRTLLGEPLPRDMDLTTLAGMDANPASGVPEDVQAIVRYGMHWRDDNATLVEQSMRNLGGDPRLVDTMPAWRTIVVPACCGQMMSEGVVAPEAAQIEAPILIACGEVDCVADPHAESKMYPKSADVQVVVVERMAHMHNFAETRREFWDHIEAFTDSVRA